MNFDNKDNVYLIAEMSANHNGDYQKAVDIVYAAKESGADAIKLQTYTGNTITLDCKNELFRIKGGTIWDGMYMFDLYQQAMTPWQWQPKLKEIAESIGLDFFSTPFDFSAVDFLEEMSVELYKIASFELIDIPLLQKVAQTKKPVIMSTGMATIDEISESVATLKNNGCSDLTLLKCTSSYPAKVEDMNLKTIVDMQKRFQCDVGLSDHTCGTLASVIAVTLGARVIEKHFCLDRADDGFDSKFSLEPAEFRKLYEDIQVVNKSLGSVSYEISESERSSLKGRKSLWVCDNLKKGDVLTPDNVRSVRPGYGMKPKYYFDVLGKSVSCDIEYGTPLKDNMISDYE